MNAQRKRGWIGILVSLLLGAAIAAAGSDNGVITGDWPVFALCIAGAFAINWLVFIPSFKAQTEHFFDLTGSITYISVTALALYLSQPLDTHKNVLGLLVIIWALRLGSFLFMRIRKDGKDGRFDTIKPSSIHFFMVWTLQGLWVSLTAGAALAAITSTKSTQPDLWLYLGAVIWLTGFLIEAIADRQKRVHRSNPDNKGEFIRTGLWSWSRHPNYFGEILLWFGVAVIAFPLLSGWQYATLISPLFVYLLLTRVSGIPMLEARADEKWGDRADYQEYKRNTPELVLRKPAR